MAEGVQRSVVTIKENEWNIVCKHQNNMEFVASPSCFYRYTLKFKTEEKNKKV